MSEHAIPTGGAYVKFEWTDSQGVRGVVWSDGRISVYGPPSMTREDGWVAIGIQLPSGVEVKEEKKDELS